MHGMAFSSQDAQSASNRHSRKNGAKLRPAGPEVRRARAFAPIADERFNTPPDGPAGSMPRGVRLSMVPGRDHFELFVRLDAQEAPAVTPSNGARFRRSSSHNRNPRFVRNW
jgi:hypothetical protein